MNILFIHPAFPGQFLYLASYLGRNPENKVYFLAEENSLGGDLKGVKVGLYKGPTDEEVAAMNGMGPASVLGQAWLKGRNILRSLDYLDKKEHFRPDIIIGHTGWGSLMYLKDFYPDVPVLGYFEWYYRSDNSDGFWWPDEKADIAARVHNRTKNAPLWLSFETCDQGLVPTKWQYDQFPAEIQQKLHIIHEGTDNDFCSPLPERPGLELHNEHCDLVLPKGTEILTYLSRGFEPYRGFHEFMDAMRIVLNTRPNTHVVIAGTDRVCYGAKTDGPSHKEQELEKGGFDESRVHWVGSLNRGDYQKMLRSSCCHVYLTRPFILSWSMLEAMSFGLPMVVSKTPPCEEVVKHDVNGLLADFRSPYHIAQKIVELLSDREKAERLGKAARETILEKYALIKCLKKQEDLIYSMVR